MIKCRHRLGEEGLEWLLTAIVESAATSGVVDRSMLSCRLLHQPSTNHWPTERTRLFALLQELNVMISSVSRYVVFGNPIIVYTVPRNLAAAAS